MSQNLKIEQAVIGSILMDNDCMYQIYNTLKAEMFQWEFTRECYKIMLAMYDRGQAIDLMTVASELSNPKMSDEQIANQLSECVLAVDSSVFVKNKADLIIKNYRSRMAKQVFEKIDLSPNAIDNSLAEMIARFEELQQNLNVRSKSLAQIVKENKDNYFNDKVTKELVRTGFYNLDECIGGLEAGDVTVIAARPAVGKSAFVTQIIGNIAKRGKRVGYFNLEMNENQVYERFLARMAELQLTRIRKAKAFLGDEKEQFDKANEQMEQMDVIISTGSKTITEIKAESRHQQFDVIVIDYLQLVKAERKFSNRASEVGEVSNAIKGLAMELKVPIILLSQLNRVSEGKETKEPTMAELRESGNIEQDASNIILIWNLSENNRSFKGVKVDKCRQSELIKEGMWFDGSHMCFEERVAETFEQFSKRAKQNDTDFQPIPDNNDFMSDWS